MSASLQVSHSPLPLSAQVDAMRPVSTREMLLEINAHLHCAVRYGILYGCIPDSITADHVQAAHSLVQALLGKAL